MAGIRHNLGKPPLDLIPVRLLSQPYSSPPLWVCRVMLFLGEFQETGQAEFLSGALRQVPRADIERAARVFEYGVKSSKYDRWNWTKGMPWSVVLGSLLRHYLALATGEELDPGSKLPHSAHLVCNLIMLVYYADKYPELCDIVIPAAEDSPSESTKDTDTGH